jgi:hypothetical protein
MKDKTCQEAINSSKRDILHHNLVKMVECLKVCKKIYFCKL